LIREERLEALILKKRWIAVETLFTCCPPDPWDRTALISISEIGISMLSDILSMWLSLKGFIKIKPESLLKSRYSKLWNAKGGAKAPPFGLLKVNRSLTQPKAS
jgi:hypothetical protein